MQVGQNLRPGHKSVTVSLRDKVPVVRHLLTHPMSISRERTPLLLVPGHHEKYLDICHNCQVFHGYECCQTVKHKYKTNLTNVMQSKSWFVIRGEEALLTILEGKLQPIGNLSLSCVSGMTRVTPSSGLLKESENATSSSESMAAPPPNTDPSSTASNSGDYAS